MTMGAMMMVRISTTSTMMAPTARGLRSSFFMPSRKKVVDSLMTSCWLFSSSEAGLNFARLIWLLNRCFLSGLFMCVPSP